MSSVVSTRRRIEAKYGDTTVGVASEYIQDFSDLLAAKPGVKVVLYCRVSGREQNRKGNLRDQKTVRLRQLEDCGADVVAAYGEITSGWCDDKLRFEVAADVARASGAVLVAESVDRFLRNIDYNNEKNQEAQPTVHEFESLLGRTKGVTLATLLPPAMPWKSVRGEQTKRGQQAKGRKGGRPKAKRPGDKKEHRRVWLSRVLSMSAHGVSSRVIAELIGMPRATVQRWIKRYGEGRPISKALPRPELP